MAGIADVAHAAGVSKATASRALSGTGYVSDATRARVRAAAKELGYVPTTSAVSLVTGRHRTVGVVVPALDRWFFAQVLSGVQEALLERGYDLALYGAPPESPARKEMFEHFLARRRFDGIVAVGIEPSTAELDLLHAFGKPVVSVGGSDTGTAAVSIDDHAAARIATEHLLSLGHRAIAFVGGDPDRQWMTFGDGRRLEGYRAAMRDAGHGDEVRHVRCEATMPGGYGAAVDLLGDRLHRPTAIVGVCDEVAVGTIIAARRLGIRVPERLSVIGIDDHEYAEMFALTTLQQRPHRQGRTAVELLLAEIEGTAAGPGRVSEPARLIMRNSTAALNDDASAIVGNLP